MDNIQLRTLRKQLLSGKSRRPPYCALDEAGWLVPNWTKYIGLLFAIDPDSVVANLASMISEGRTLQLKGGLRGGIMAIEARPLGELEKAALNGLHEEYGAKLAATWSGRSIGEAGQANAQVTLRQSELVQELVAAESRTVQEQLAAMHANFKAVGGKKLTDAEGP